MLIVESQFTSSNTGKMATELTMLKQPITIRPEHVASCTTTLRLKSKSRIGGDYIVSTVAPDGSGSSTTSGSTELFIVDGNVTSWSQRRYFRDASGLPLFDLHRKSSGVTWFVQMPGGSSEPIATLAPRWSTLKDKCDVYVANASANGEEAMLEVRGQDVWKKRTHVYANGALVMRAKMANMASVYIPGKRLEWEFEVSEGLDISLVSSLLFYLAYCSQKYLILSSRRRSSQCFWRRIFTNPACRRRILPMDQVPLRRLLNRINDNVHIL